MSVRIVVTSPGLGDIEVVQDTGVDFRDAEAARSQLVIQLAQANAKIVRALRPQRSGLGPVQGGRMSARDPLVAEDADRMANLMERYSDAWDCALRYHTGREDITYNARDKDRFIAHMILTTGGFKSTRQEGQS